MALTTSGARFLVALFLVCTPDVAVAKNSGYRRNLAASELRLVHGDGDDNVGGDSDADAGMSKSLVVGLVVAAVLAGTLLLVTVFPPVLVCAIQCLGFTATGIAAASWAAWIMSLSAGYVVAGSVCAVCQSIGALGVITVTSLGALVAAICVALVPVLPYLALAILVLGLLAALIFVVVKYVAPSIGGFFSGIFSGIGGFFSSIGSFFSGLIPFLTLTSLGPVKTFFTRLMEPFSMLTTLTPTSDPSLRNSS